MVSPSTGFPPPDSPEERAAFSRLQAGLRAQFQSLFPDRLAERTVVVLPSLSLDQDVLGRVAGVHHYEERMLSMLMLLRWPRTRLVYVTSQPLSETIIDYYLHLLPGVPTAHARARLTLLACHDGSDRPLTEKVLERPHLMRRLAAAVGDPARAHIAAYTVSALERTLAVRLGTPLYGCDPDLQPLGSKSGGRRVLREAGVEIPDGVEDLPDPAAVADALAGLRERNPDLKRAVVKLNQGFSGEGNAVFRFAGAPAGPGLASWVAERLSGLSFEARGMTWEAFAAKIVDMGAIVEAFVEGREKTSPSAQYRIDPMGGVECVSTHDQVLGGPGGQVFLGCRFPAREDYRLEIQAAGLRVGAALARRGVIGRFGVDFVSVREDGRWRHRAIEINLRKGGTTHPFMMLQFLTGGGYNPRDGLLRTPSGQARFYSATDNLESAAWRGLTPDDLVDIAVLRDLHYDAAAHEGVVFHLIGAASQFGKLGLVAVGASPLRAQAFYDRAVAALTTDGAGL